MILVVLEFVKFEPILFSYKSIVYKGFISFKN